MLQPIQMSGSNPPLFLVHDEHGVVPFGSAFARVLGRDQPLYAIHAAGMNGRPVAPYDLDTMLRAYVAEIHGARPIGPLLIGGLGSGALAAMALAGWLHESGRQIGPVILLDPQLGIELDETPAAGPLAAGIAGPAYSQVRSALLDYGARCLSDLPFSAGDPKQLHAATLAGTAVFNAFGRHTPQPFAGAVELLLSEERAEEFFRPKLAWQQLLGNEQVVHVSPWSRAELFRSGLEASVDALKFLVDEAIECLQQDPNAESPGKAETPATRNTREKWDAIWRDRTFLPDWWVDGPHTLIREIVEHDWLPERASVLEIGCGAGQGAAWLSRAGFKVTGIDISQEAVNRARADFAHAGGPNFIVADVTAPDPLKTRFDGIIDAGCFHTLSAEQHAKYFENILSWSRPGTRFMLLMNCTDRRLDDLLEYVRALFLPDFRITASQTLAGSMPRDPSIVMMSIQLIRRELGI